MNQVVSQRVLRLAHSPDPDDAFMWWPLFRGDDGSSAPLAENGFTFEPVRSDIETLNERSTEAVYEITAISCAQYPHVADRYAITRCGASMGERYGPKLVARSKAMTIESLAEGSCPIAVPGRRTTAALLVGLILEHDGSRFVAAPFDEIEQRVAAGEFEAGVVIHEGQLTYERAGLHLVCDVGAWWFERFDLPLPLGLNVVRRDLDQRFGEGTVHQLADLQRRSIEYALANREAGLDRAIRFARGVSRSEADRFIQMYVNRYTVDAGETGLNAIRTLLAEGARVGLLPALRGEVSAAGAASG